MVSCRHQSHPPQDCRLLLKGPARACCPNADQALKYRAGLLSSGRQPTAQQSLVQGNSPSIHNPGQR